MSSNRLAILAAEIRDADGRFRRSSEETAAAALDAGRALIEAKALLPHGGWLPWLRERVAMSERTAQLYMRLSRSGLEIRNVADLGIKAASEAIARKTEPDHMWGEPMPCSAPAAGEMVLIQMRGEVCHLVHIWPSPNPDYFNLLGLEHSDNEHNAWFGRRPAAWNSVRRFVQRGMGYDLGDPGVSLELQTDVDTAALDDMLRLWR